MMLIIYRCTVSFNNYSTLNTFLLLHCMFTFYYLYVHSNVRMATGCVNSVYRYKAQCAILMTSLKLTTASFFIHCRISIFENILYIFRPPDKSAYWKIIFFISHPKQMLWVLKKNRLNETVLLSTQNTCLN